MTDKQNTTEPCRPACPCPTCVDRRRQAFRELDAMSDAPFDPDLCCRDAIKQADSLCWNTDTGFNLFK